MARSSRTFRRAPRKSTAKPRDSSTPCGDAPCPYCEAPGLRAIVTTMAATPKDAGSIIILKDPDDPKLLWVKRNDKLMFMGGFHAFPGGQLDKEDQETPVSGYAGDEAAMRACAAREVFEEIGVLLAEGAERLTTAQIAEARRALASG